MATTTNFAWTTPDDTALVKDGASAIRTLGSAIDTSMAQLKGGTTGQVLAKTSNTDMAFTWTTTSVTGFSLISSTALSGASTVVSGIAQTYKHLLVTLARPYVSTNSVMTFRVNGDSATSYNSAATLDTKIFQFGQGATSTTDAARTGADVWIYNYTAQPHGFANYSLSYGNAAGQGSASVPYAYYGATSVTSVGVYLSTGTFSGGFLNVYGVN